MRPSDPLKRPSFLWRRLRAWAFNVAAVCIITLAVIVGIGRLLAPYADVLRPHLEVQLSQALNAEVSIDEVSASWPGFMPSLGLRGLSIEQDQVERFGLEFAVIEIHWLNVFKRQEAMIHLALVGPTVMMSEQPDGRWQFMWRADSRPGEADEAIGHGSQRLEPDMGLANQWPNWLGLSVRDASWILQLQNKIPIELHLAEADFLKRGQQYRLTGWLSAEKDGAEQVQFALSVRRSNQQWVNATAWMDAQEISLSYWLAEAGLEDLLSVKTIMSAEAWLTWDVSKGGRVDAKLEWAGPQGRLSSQIKAQRSVVSDGGRTWAIEIPKLEFRDRTIIDTLAIGVSPDAYALAIDWANLGMLHQALSPWLDRYDGWPDLMQGEVESWVLGVDGSGRVHQAQGELKALKVRYAEPQLTLDATSLGLSLLGDRLAVVLDEAIEFHWPSVIQAPIALSSTRGQIVVSRDQVQFDQIHVANEFIEATLNGAIYQQHDTPFVDLLIEANKIEAVDVRPFLPRRIIPEPAMRWLDEALVYIDQASGHALLHFPVGLKTADFQPGHLQAEVLFSGVEMAYARNWPTAEALSGWVQFSGQSLVAEVEQGTAATLNLSAPRLFIEKLSDAVIELDLEGEGVSSKDLSQALGQLPFEGWSDVFGQMQWSGALDAETSIVLPIKKRDQWSIEGDVGFNGNRVEFGQAGIALDDLQGAINFDRRNIEGVALTGVFEGQTLALDTHIGFTPKPRVEIRTDIDVGKWLTNQPSGAYWSQWLSGQSELALTLEPSSMDSGLAVEFTSQLQGLEMRLPAPFNKAAEEPWPVTVSRSSFAADEPWVVSAERFGQAWLRPAEAGWSIAISSGANEEAAVALPSKQGLYLTGRLDALDVDAWSQVIQGDDGIETTAGSFWDSVLGQQISAQVSIDELSIPGVVPGQARVGVSWLEDQWVFDVDGPKISGQVLWPVTSDRSRSVVVDLSHAHLLTSTSSSEDMPISPPNLQDPRLARPITVAIESLYWGELALGGTRLETHATANGMEIELLDIDGPDLRLQARGRWVQPEAGEPRSLMTGRLSSRNFNQLIRATGYEAGLRAQQATVDFELDWPGTPTDFNLFRVAGGIDFVLRGGNIPQASAGAGRLLGLVSFTALPRRLMLDFRDVFGSGFPFDGIQGRFDMQAGMAQTQGVKIASPAAVITLTGSTDMIARTYDQEVLVEPGLGSTLPVIGGLAGGPVGAAAGLILQSILNQPLKGVSMARYTITGPWSDPIIELVDATVAEASQRQADEPQADQPPPNGDG